MATSSSSTTTNASSSFTSTPPPPPTSSSSPSFLSSLVAGGAAGTCVDVALYPIDTIKTRLQAPGGFWKAGGFRGIYHGLGAVALGSAPGAALFFSTYEQSKQMLREQRERLGVDVSDATVHMAAASAGEFVACLVRVPTEIIKARMQTAAATEGPTKRSIMGTVQTLWDEPALVKGNSNANNTRIAGLGGLYRGFGITLFREIPFSMIQFPLYEWGKQQCRQQSSNGECSPLAAAACGSLSGAVAGALTTPLDVLKTRTMLGADRDGHRYTSVTNVLQRTLQAEGPVALWHGLQPRVIWISLGGFVFFGAYEAALRVVRPVWG